MTEKEVIKDAIQAGATQVYRIDKDSMANSVSKRINGICYAAYIWSYGGNGPWWYFTGFNWENFGSKMKLGERIY